MAKETTIKTIFAIDGETRYIEAVKRIKDEQSVLRSELKRVDETYKLNGDAIQYNKDKIVILNEQIVQQNKRVSEAKHVLEQANRQYGEGSKESNRYAKDLNYAEAGLAKLKKELVDASIELEKQKSLLIKSGNALQDFGKKAKSFGKPLESVGKTLSKTVTAPLMALGGVAVKSAMDFETAMAGVRKTTDMTDEEFAAMSQSIRDMAKEIPATTTEIAAVAEAAGQLGIQKENILGFTRTIVDLGVASNLTGEDGAMMLAKFANITQMPQADFDRLGSTIVELGNNTATTEKDIAELMMRIAGAGSQAGMSQADMAGLAAALSAAGMEAQAGGSAISRVISKIQLAVETGSESLYDFAAVAGMSAEDFQKAFKDDAAGALSAFITGLGDTDRAGMSTIQMLEYMEITELRTRDALLRLSGSGDILTDALKMGNEAWEENIALTKEAEMFYATSANQMVISKNRMNDAAITLGQELLPVVVDVVEFVAKLVEGFNDLDPATQKTIIQVAAVAAALGPLLTVTGKVVKGFGSAAEGIGKLLTKLGEKKAIEKGTEAVEGLGKAAGGAATKLGIGAGLGLAAAAGLVVAHIINVGREAAKGSEALQDLERKIESSEKKFKSSTSEIETNAEAAKKLADHIFDLSRQEDKSATHKEALRIKIKQLNDLYPDLNLAITDEAGNLNLAKDAVYDYIDARKEQQLTEAHAERQNELIREQIELERERKEAVEKLSAVQDESWVKWDEASQTWKQGWKDWGYIGSQHDELIATYERSTKALGENADQQKYHADKIEEYSQRTTDAKGAAAEGSAQADSDMMASDDTRTQNEIENSLAREEQLAKEEEDRRKYYESMLEKARSYSRQMNGIDDEAITYSELTADNLMENWDRQREEFDRWRAALAVIAKKVPPEMYNELKEMGPAITPALEEMGQMGVDELELGVIEAWRKKTASAVDAAAEELSKMPGAGQSSSRDLVAAVRRELGLLPVETWRSGVKATSDYAAGVMSRKLEASNAGASVRNSAVSGSRGGSWYSSGYDGGSSFASGVADSAWKARKAAYDMADGAVASARNRLKQRSPSRVMLEMGGETATSYAMGIERKTDAVRASGVKLAEAAIKPLEDLDVPDLDFTSRINAASGYVAGVDAITGVRSAVGGNSIDKSRTSNITLNVTVESGASPETGRQVGRVIVDELVRERIARGEPM